MGSKFITAFAGFILFWGAIWLTMFVVLIPATVFRIYKGPLDDAQKRRWGKAVGVALFVVAIIYAVILYRALS